MLRIHLRRIKTWFCLLNFKISFVPGCLALSFDEGILIRLTINVPSLGQQRFSKKKLPSNRQIKGLRWKAIQFRGANV